MRSIMIPYEDNFIRKKILKNDEIQDLPMQKHIHGTAYYILQNYKILKTPAIMDRYDNYYIMERIDTSKPIWLGDKDSCDSYDANLINDLKKEVIKFWNDMWDRNFAAWGFDLYLQPDSKVMMIGYSGFKARCGDTIDRNLFDYPSFPK